MAVEAAGPRAGDGGASSCQALRGAAHAPDGGGRQPAPFAAGARYWQRFESAGKCHRSEAQGAVPA